MADVNLAEKRRMEREARLKELGIKREEKNTWWQKPWMGEQEIEEIKPLVVNARVFEYGSGGSTIFFGAKAKEYYSLETDKNFYEEVRDRLTFSHVGIFYETDHEKYLNKINEISGEFDVILVDNDEIPRIECALRAFDFLKENGTLLIHDSTFTDRKEEMEKNENRKEKLQKFISQLPSRRVAEILSNHGKEGIAWDKLKSEFHPLLKKYTLRKTVQSLSLFKKNQTNE
jgi:hypothetical protein